MQKWQSLSIEENKRKQILTWLMLVYKDLGCVGFGGGLLRLHRDYVGAMLLFGAAHRGCLALYNHDR